MRSKRLKEQIGLEGAQMLQAKEVFNLLINS